MLPNKKLSTGGLVLAGLAAFAWYKYSKMSSQEKEDMIGGLKEKGQKLYDEYVPQNVKDMISSKGANMGAEKKFTEENQFS